MKKVILNSKWLKKFYTEEVTLIGEGSYSKVYELEEPSEKDPSRKKKALKVVRKDEDEDSKTWDNVEEETDIMQELENCDQVIKLFNYNLDKGCQFIVMDLARRSLSEMLKTEEKVGVAQLKILIETLLKGVSFAHEKSIVHRDLKPSNILQLPSGEFVISDWGAARKYNIRNMKKAKMMNASEEIVGTEIYMAPELNEVKDDASKPVTLRHAQATAKKADIYAIGLVILVCCGIPERELYSIKKNNEKDHQNSIYQLWNSRDTKTYEEFFFLIDWMCKFRPEERPGADELLKATGKKEAYGEFRRESRILLDRMEKANEIDFSENFKELRDVLEDLRKDPRSVIVNFRGCKEANNECIEQLAFKKPKSLEYLYVDLSGTKIDAKGLSKLPDFLSRDLKVLRLVLNHLSITDDSLLEILKAVRNLSQLQDFNLSLRGTQITDASLKNIYHAVKNLGSLSILDITISGTKIGEEAFRLLIQNLLPIPTQNVSSMQAQTKSSISALKVCSLDFPGNSKRKSEIKELPPFLNLIESEE